jgi:hypothetical protein
MRAHLIAQSAAAQQNSPVTESEAEHPRVQKQQPNKVDLEILGDGQRSIAASFICSNNLDGTI